MRDLSKFFLDTGRRKKHVEVGAGTARANLESFRADGCTCPAIVRTVPRLPTSVLQLCDLLTPRKNAENACANVSKLFEVSSVVCFKSNLFTKKLK